MSDNNNIPTGISNEIIIPDISGNPDATVVKLIDATSQTIVIGRPKYRYREIDADIQKTYNYKEANNSAILDILAKLPFLFKKACKSAHNNFNFNPAF